jgi:hypothetical protein
VGSNFGKTKGSHDKYLNFEDNVVIIIWLLERLCPSFAHFEEICWHSSTAEIRQMYKTADKSKNHILFKEENMMKSFFKKLAFVMALAMVITMAAPAAQKAVAADKALAVTYQNEKTYSISELNLANVGDTEDLKFLWAPSNWKELGVKWTSSNENVVTVDNSGVVTGVAAGSATVSVAVGTETASVVVNVEELPAYTVSIGLGDEKSVTEKELEIGESVDFAFYGIKDYARDKVGALPRYLCTWQSDDTTVLTKDNEAGLFTAVAAGTAKVTLTVANVLTGQTHNVIPVAVTVKAPVVEEVEVDVVAELNKTQDIIEVKLDKDAGLDLNNVEVFRVFFADDDYNGDGTIDEQDIDKNYEDVYVYGVTFNSTTGNWDVNTFDDFIDGVTYEVHVKNYEPERFVASVGDVTEVVVYEKDGASLATEDTELDAAHVGVLLYDAKGVDVTTRKIDGVANNDISNVTFWLTDMDAAEYSLVGYDEIEFYEMATADVRATYDLNGKPVDSPDPCLITPSKAGEYGIKKVVAWTLVKDEAKADWTKPVHDVPSGEYGYTIVTLLEDTRGNYFVTHKNSATTNGGNKYNNAAVYYTEDEYAPFWIHGYRVEYRAMDPDKMLVEDYGDVASYEMGRARFALYLYNQFETADKEFIRELYSQYVNVCHPMQLNKATATTNVKIQMNTEYDEETGVLTVNESNAYYSLFSTGKIDVVLWDIHADTKAKADHAAEAEFELKLISNTDNADLQALIASYQDELNATNAVERSINVEAKQFANFAGNIVKFTITEKVTKTKITVTISLVRPETETDPLGVKSAKVATIDEYSDYLKVKLPFEKFVVSQKGFTVEQSIAELAKATHSYDVFLYQADKYGNKIGVDNNLYVATTLDFNKMKEADVITNGVVLEAGDRVLTIKAPSGKIYPSANGVYGLYTNPAYTKKDDGFAYPASTSALGVSVKTVDDYAKSASGSSVSVNKYNFVFRTTEDVGYGPEIVYAENGRYTVTIKTVKAIKADGTIEFTKSTGLTDTFYITVNNNNAQVKYAGRDLTRVEDASVTGYGFNTTKNAEVGTDPAVKALILKAFNFTLGGAAWAEKDGALTTDNILYYTYTATPTNKQVVINKVVFKVPSDAADKNTDDGTVYGWYRSAATVNKSLTFDYE